MLVFFDTLDDMFALYLSLDSSVIVGEAKWTAVHAVPSSRLVWCDSLQVVCWVVVALGPVGTLVWMMLPNLWRSATRFLLACSLGECCRCVGASPGLSRFLPQSGLSLRECTLNDRQGGVGARR